MPNFALRSSSSGKLMNFCSCQTNILLYLICENKIGILERLLANVHKLKTFPCLNLSSAFEKNVELDACTRFVNKLYCTKTQMSYLVCIKNDNVSLALVFAYIETQI